MKTKIKVCLGSAFVACALSFNSCTDLSETIYDTMSPDVYEFTPEDTQALFVPVYNRLRDVLWGWYSYSDISGLAGDLWCIPNRIGIGWGDLYIPLHKHEFNPDIDHFSVFWDRAYAGINACNQLLEDPTVQSVESTVAQLRAYRALYYYMLFDAYRNIPLDTQASHEAGWLPTQATPQETWDFIITELNDIKGKCGKENIMGRINDYAVNMLLANMYINHNAWFNDDSDKSWYGKCIDELDEIIDSGLYDLAPNYLDCFKEDISKNLEIIFGIPYTEKYGGGNYYASMWLAVISKQTYGFNTWATSGANVLSQFLDSYDPADERYDDCWNVDTPQYASDGTPLMANGEPVIYTKEIRSIDQPGCYEYEGGRLVKYEILPGDMATNYDDVPFYRYADVLLKKAECLLRLGGYKGETEQDAADLVTRVRARNFKANPEKAVRTVAQLKGGSNYPYGHRENRNEMGQNDPAKIFNEYEGGADIELGGLLDERAWEFVGEYVRRQDLIRFKMTNGQNVFNGKSWFCKPRMKDVNDNHYNIFPIPKEAIEGNPKLVQNPGY